MTQELDSAVEMALKRLRHWKTRDEFPSVQSHGIIYKPNNELTNKYRDNAVCVGSLQSHDPKYCPNPICHYFDFRDHAPFYAYKDQVPIDNELYKQVAYTAVHYLFHPTESPFSDIFDTEYQYQGRFLHDPDFVFENGGYILTNLKAHTTTAAVLFAYMRNHHEYHNGMLTFYFLIKAGANPHLAFVLSFVFNTQYFEPHKIQISLNSHSAVNVYYSPEAYINVAKNLQNKNRNIRKANNKNLLKSCDYSPQWGDFSNLYFHQPENFREHHEITFDSWQIKKSNVELKTKHATLTPHKAVANYYTIDSLIERALEWSKQV